jgi:hypothetical protein
MKKATGLLLGALISGSSILAAHAEEDIPLNSLTAQWVQWALSIPTTANPQLDTTGENCMVGLLAGVFNGGMATRTCSVPADKVLSFPVANAFNINTPNVCGQTRNLTVAELRDMSAAFVAGITSKSVKVDGQSANIQRIQSIVFEVALPRDNVFNPLCGGPGTVPAGIYSPAVDDGFYVKLRPLQVGNHTVQFSAKSAQGVVQNVTYNLNVVRVSLE